MFWNERLEWIKQTYHLTPDDLKIQWMQWDTIRERMQQGFREYQVQNIKVEIVPSLSCHYLDVFRYLFQREKRYWLDFSDNLVEPYLYDCTLAVADLLLRHSYSSNYAFSQFAIIDKKYKWATYFTRSNTYTIATLTICGKELHNRAIELKAKLEK